MDSVNKIIKHLYDSFDYLETKEFNDLKYSEKCISIRSLYVLLRDFNTMLFKEWRKRTNEQTLTDETDKAFNLITLWVIDKKNIVFDIIKENDF